MGKAGMLYREIRVIVEDDLTQVYVLIEALGDCPLGVQGWHHKTFAPSVSVVDIIHGFGTKDGDPVMWGQEAPPK